MSYLPIDPNANTQGPSGQTTNVPGQTGGAGSTAPPPQSGSAGAGQAAGAPSGASNGSPTQFGSSASKLGDYLSANAPQIGAQANTVSQGLNQQYGQVQGDIGNAANQFGQTVSGGYTPQDTTGVNAALTNAQQGIAPTTQQAAAFQGQLNDTYTGPTSYEGSTPYSNIQNEVGTAVQNAGLLSNPAGLGNYLSGTSGGNQTQASNTLDQLLLSGNPAANQQIQQAAGQFSGLTGQLANSVTGQDQGILAAQQNAAAANAAANAGLNTGYQNFNTNLNNELTTQQGNLSNYNNELANLQKSLAGGTAPTNIGSFDPTATGLASQAQAWEAANAPAGLFGAANYSNLAPAGYTGTAPNLASVETAPDAATLNALSQLGAGNSAIPVGNTPGGFSLAPGGPSPTINNSGYAQDILNQFDSPAAAGLQVNAPAFNQYNSLQNQLQQYLNQPTTPTGVVGPGAPPVVSPPNQGVGGNPGAPGYGTGPIGNV